VSVSSRFAGCRLKVTSHLRRMPSPPFSSIYNFCRREPLAHFFAAALLLFFVHRIFFKREISVSLPLVQGLRKEYEATGHKVDETTLQRLVADYVEDEILYQEALRSGFLRDNRVRALLIETMRKSLRPVLPPPTDANLEQLRAEAPEAYRYPPQVSFEHVSFLDDKNMPAGLLDKLRSGAPATGMGDPAVRVANPLPPTYAPQLERVFGPEFTQSLLQCEVGVWTGPFKSLRGVHFVRVVKRDEGGDMPLKEVRTTLASQWVTNQENAAISRKVAELRRSYRVNIAPTTAARP
jgi:hypothetical protein